MTVAVREVEPEVLGELEVKEEVQIREGHQVSLVPDPEGIKSGGVAR